jgi:hypothetical protein
MVCDAEEPRFATSRSGWLANGLCPPQALRLERDAQGRGARVDITPAQGAHLWGYSSKKSAATGTLDSLDARVLVLAVGTQSLALVDVDLGRPFGPASLQTSQCDSKRRLLSDS